MNSSDRWGVAVTLASAVLASGTVHSQPAQPLLFSHMADASAVEWLGAGLIAVACDEDNILRTYRLPQGGPPVSAHDLSPWLELARPSPEADIEGSARIGDRIYWITSHAPNREGKPRPNRRRFFATRLDLRDGVPALVPEGRPVTTLLDLLDADPRYAGFGLAAAALRPPKTPGSLNIEALCDTPDGGLLIGFRSPTPSGMALLAPLVNPSQAVAGQPARFGAPLLLDLGGNGLRALVRLTDGYRLLAGSPLSGGRPQLYRWDGVRAPVRVPLDGLPPDATPEALAAVETETGPALLMLSDDGALMVDGRPAKEHPVPARRTFRGFLLPL